MQLHVYAPTWPCAYCMPTCKGVVVSNTKSTHVVSCYAISFTSLSAWRCEGDCMATNYMCGLFVLETTTPLHVDMQWAHGHVGA